MGTRRTRTDALRWVCLVLAAASLSACSAAGDSPGPAHARDGSRVTAPAADPPAPPGPPATDDDDDDDDDAASIRRLATAARELDRDELMAMPLSEQARLLSACAPLSWGDLYCLGFGFVTERPDHRAALRPPRYESTGDLSFRDWVARRAALPRRERLVEQREEAVNASLGVDKARSLSRMVEGPEREWPDEL